LVIVVIFYGIALRSVGFGCGGNAVVALALAFYRRQNRQASYRANRFWLARASLRLLAVGGKA